MDIEKVRDHHGLLLDPSAVLEEQILRDIIELGKRVPLVYPAQLRGFGAQNFLVTDDSPNQWYSIVGQFYNCGGFPGHAYVANACNTWSILATELLRLRQENKELRARLGSDDEEHDG